MGKSLSIPVGRGILHAVPSVHFRAPFARRVNALCRLHQPDAVAVELEFHTGIRLLDALDRLSNGAAPPETLPCMFALAESTVSVGCNEGNVTDSAAEHRRKSISLSHTNTKARSRINVLYLSPTDSIVEAARCAIELDVPFYGVDIATDGNNEPCYWGIQDPQGAFHSFEDYVQRNKLFADSHRTPEHDLPREIAMARALKTLLDMHSCVVFVCGLAHWHSIENLLSTGIEGFELGFVSGTQSGPKRTLTLVHPQLAAPYMDTSPAFAYAFEAKRRRATDPPHGSDEFPDGNLHFANLLKRSYQEHFATVTTSEQIDTKFPDWRARDNFEDLLRNLSIVRQNAVPDMAATLTASQGVMSRSFRETLTTAFMEFPWAKPADYPDCSIMLPAYKSSGMNRQVRMVGFDGKTIGTFDVEGYPSATPKMDGETWVWDDEPCLKSERYSGTRSNWMPIGYFRMAMELEAIDELRTGQEYKRPQAFEGSIEDGIDIRSTIRAASRGERRVHVRTGFRQSSQISEDAAHGYPLLWIFREESDDRMHLQFGGDRLEQYEPYAQDLPRLQAVRRELGDRVVMDVRYCSETRDSRLSRPGCHITREKVGGVLSFQPGSFTVKQMALWCERTAYARNPICSLFSWHVDFATQLARYYEERHNIRIADRPWHAQLLLAALPFARCSITVIAPDDYTVVPDVTAHARRRQVTIHRVPLSRFSLDKLRYASQHIMIPILGRTVPEDLPIYPDHVCRMLGESPRRNLNLLPKRIANYENIG